MGAVAARSVAAVQVDPVAARFVRVECANCSYEARGGEAKCPHCNCTSWRRYVPPGSALLIAAAREQEKRKWAAAHPLRMRVFAERAGGAPGV